jgi:hypothetical protein
MTLDLDRENKISNRDLTSVHAGWTFGAIELHGAARLKATAGELTADNYVYVLNAPAEYFGTGSDPNSILAFL